MLTAAFHFVSPMNACFVALLAYEILGNLVKRRSYDSVDPQFDDSIPSVTAESRQNFFEVFSPVFEQNSRYGFTTRCSLLFLILLVSNAVEFSTA